MKKLFAILLFSTTLICLTNLPFNSLKAQTTVTIGTGTYTQSYPFYTYYDDAKTQMLYKASEIQAAGGVAGDILSIAFNVASRSSKYMSGFNIHMKNVSNTTLSSSMTTSGMTTVYSSGYSVPGTGWRTINLQTPFAWNGSSNLLVSVCFNNSSYSSNSTVRCSSVVGSVVHYHTDNASGCSFSSGSVYSYRPNIKLTIDPSAYNDAGISSITNPTSPTSPGTDSVKAVIKNYGQVNLTTCAVKYSVDGTTQSTYNFSGSISPNGLYGPITLGAVNLPLGNHVIKVWSELPNAVNDSNKFNDTTTANIISCQTLNGTYTIGGTGSNFSSFNDALSTLNTCGVSGPVIFNVAMGIYLEQLNILTIPGVSSTKTVTFQSASGDSTNVILAHSPISSVSNYTIKLNGTDYVSFKKMTIKSYGSSYSRVIDIGNDANNVEFSNCIIDGVATTGTSNQNAVIYSNYSSDDTLSFLNNVIKNGSFALQISGTSSSVLANGLVIQNNIISDYSAYGIYMNYQNKPQIIGNSLSSANNGNNTYGIYLYYCDNDLKIQDNKIHLLGSSSNYGIFLYYCDGTSSSKGLIANNMVAEITPTTSISYGLYIYRSYNQRIFFNSSQILSTNYSSAPLFVYDYSGIDILNNVFSNIGNGYAAYVNNGLSISFSDYNDFYSTGAYIAYWGGNHTTFAALKTSSGKDGNSKNVDPEFYSNSNLHSSSPVLNGASIPISVVPNDIDGETRSTTSPDIGADEFTIPANDAGVVEMINPIVNPCAGSSLVKVKIKNFGSSTLTSVIVNWKVNGATQTPVTFSGSIAPNTSDTVTLGYYTFLANVTYNIKSWTSSPNSSTDGNTANDTLIKSGLVTALGGTLTVGSGGNYSTISAAIADLALKGICGPTIVNISPGFYSEQITIPYIPGTNSINTVTFQSSTGDSSNVIITNTPSSSTYNYVVRFDSAQYINLKSLTIQNGSSNYGTVIKFENYSKNIKVLNNKLVGPVVTTTSTNHAVIFSANSYEANIIIQNNNFQNGSMGVYSTQNSSVPTDNYLIKGNSFNNQYGYGVYLSYHKNAITTENQFASSAYYSYYAIYYYNVDQNFQITKNRINNSTSGAGIYLNNCDGISSARGLVANNFIRINTTGNTANGIYISYATYIGIYHNSINITGNYASYNNRCFGIYGTINNFDIRNNIFANNANGLAFYANVHYSYFTSNNNDLYSTGTNILYDDYANTYHQTLTSWKSTSGDENNSISVNPLFTSISDLHVSNPLLKSAGNAVTYVTDDIDGQIRNTSTPDIGADEFIIPALDASLVQFVEPSANVCIGSNPVKVELRNSGSNTLTSVAINWKVNGVSQTAYSWTGSLLLGASTTVNIGSYTFASNGTYSLSAWTSSPNGSTDLNTANDSVNLTNLQPALGGTLTIGGSGADYSTIAAAISDMTTKGICGSVVFNIATGTYNEQVVIPSSISGVSAYSTITFQSATGDSSDVIIQYYSNISSANYVISFNGTNNVIFKNLTIKNISTASYTRVISFSGSSQNVEISNCQIIGRNVSNYSNYYALFYNAGYDNKGLVLSNNLFKYGSYAIYNQGPSSLVDSLKILNNVFENQYAYGMYLYYHNAPIISGNKITIASGSYVSYISMYLRYCDYGMQITKNKISSTSNGGYGIYMYYCDGYSSSKGLIANNFIQLNTTGSQTHGIYTYYSYQHNFYYNSIHITGNYASSGNTCMRYYGSSYAYYDLKNNNFYNHANGYALYLYSSPSSSYFASDYNNFYTSGSYFNYRSGNRASLSAWQSYVGKDYNSLSVDPQFTSNSDLHVNNMSLNGQGYYVASVTDDIDGDLRSSNPDIGADEIYIGPPMAGVYTIGSDTADDYSSFTNATNALNGRGISASVTFNVDSGTYVENFEISDIQGVSSTKTVLFQSVSGDSSDVIVSYDASSTADNYVVKLYDCEYITLKHLTLKALDNNYSTVINIYNDTNITIQNCQIEGTTSTSTSYYNSLVYATGHKKSINFKNNYFLNGSYGMYINGYSSSNRDNNLLIENNNFSSQYYMGLYIINQNAPIIKNNIINAQSSAYYGYYGAYLYYCDNGFEFTGNKIVNQSDGGYGLYARYCDGTSSNRGLIANNFISVQSNSYVANGLYIYYNNYMNIFHNNINVYGSFSGGYGLYMYGSSGTNSLNLRNNNIVMKTGNGYAIYAYLNPSYYTNNYNNLYTTGTYLAYENGSYCTTLQTWKTYSYEGYNSLNVDPGYISNTNLHVTNNSINNSGTSVGISTDIDGETRNTSTPDIGADEFTPAAYDIGMVQLISPNYAGCFSSSETVILQLKNFGTQTIGFSTHPITVSASVAGPNTATFTPVVVNTGSLSPGNILNVTVSTSFNMSTSGSYVFNASAVMVGDGNTFNNTLSPVSITNSSVATFPFTEPFTSFSNGTTNFPNGWLGSNTNNSSYKWTADYGGTGSSYTGPYYDASSSSYGRYLYTESSYGTYNDQAHFVSPCIDVSGLTNPKMSFYYHMYGSSMGELAIDVLYNGSWIPQDSISGQQQTSRYAAWTEKKIDLSTYPGTIKVRFRSTKTSYSSYGDMAIDNIRISDFPEVNLGNDTGACAGQTVTLNAGSGTGYTYQWYKVGITGLQNATQYFTISASGAYYVVVTNSSGDFDSDTINVNIANPVTPTIIGLNSTYCSAYSSVTLSGNPAGGTFSGNGITGNIFNPATSGIGTHTISYTYADQYGCQSIGTQNTTVNQSATISLSGLDSTYCANNPDDTAIFSPTGGTFLGAGTSGNIFSPSTAGAGIHSLTYMYTSPNGCIGIINKTITVYSLPNVSFSVLGTSFCQDAPPFTLIATPTGGTFSGNGVSGNIFSPATVGIGTHPITYTTPPNSNACTNSTTQNVVVNGLPNVSITNLNNTYCTNEPAIILSGTPAGGTFTVDGITATQFNPTTSGIGVYTVVYVYSDMNSCSNSDTVVVNVVSLPNVSFSGLAPFYCINSIPDTLIGSPLGGTFTGPGINGNIFDPSISGAGSHQIIYTYSLGGNCGNSDTITTQVYTLPIANAGNDATITCGSGIGIGNLPLTGYTYSWSPTAGLSNPNISNPLATLNVTTLFTLTITDIATGCSNTDQVLVTVSGGPTVTAGPDTSICSGNSVTITASNGVSYLWSTNDTTQSITVAPIVTTAYTVTVYDALGCAGVDTAFITIHQPPMADAGIDTSIACGASAVMIGSSPISGYSYLWYPTIGLSNSTIANPMANPIVSTIYTVVVTDSQTGCTATDDVLVVKTGGPTAVASNDTVICFGESVLLTVSGGTSYTWNTGDTTSSIIVSPAITTIYVVTVTDGSCYGLDSVVVTVNNPFVFLGVDTTLCENDSITLDAGKGFSSYLWSDNSTGQTLTVDTTGYGIGTHTFSVNVVDSIGCEATDSIEITFTDCTGIKEIIDNINVNVYPNPTKGLINLDINGQTSAYMNFCLINMHGQIIWCETLEKSNDKLHKEIDLGIHPKGIYYLRINDETNVIVKKVIVQ